MVWLHWLSEMLSLPARIGRLEKVMSITQAQLDALTQELKDVKDVVVAIDTNVGTLQQEIVDLKAAAAAGEALDFSGVQAAADAIRDEAAKVATDSTPPAP